jgi:hypothetical protein
VLFHPHVLKEKIWFVIPYMPRGKQMFMDIDIPTTPGTIDIDGE